MTPRGETTSGLPKRGPSAQVPPGSGARAQERPPSVLVNRLIRHRRPSPMIARSCWEATRSPTTSERSGTSAPANDAPRSLEMLTSGVTAPTQLPRVDRTTVEPSPTPTNATSPVELVEPDEVEEGEPLEDGEAEPVLDGPDEVADGVALSDGVGDAAGVGVDACEAGGACACRTATVTSRMSAATKTARARKIRRLRISSPFRTSDAGQATRWSPQAREARQNFGVPRFPASSLLP